MGTFKQLKSAFQNNEQGAGPLRPAKIINIGPGEFSDDWDKKPRSQVTVGLRLLPADEDSVAQKQAAKAAVSKYPTPGENEAQREQEYKDAFIAWCVARAMCDPNDVRKPHPKFPMAEDTIRGMLTGPALTRVFDEIERHHIESSPLYQESTDEELENLAALLAVPNAMIIFPEAQAARLRRYAYFVLSELLEAQTTLLGDELEREEEQED